MSTLVIQILAMALTISQLANHPVDQFQKQFDVIKDRPKIDQLLTEGCGYMVKEFHQEKTDFEILFKAIQQAQEASAAEEKSSPAPAEPKNERLKYGLASILKELPNFYALYEQYCKGKSDNPVDLTKAVEFYNNTMANLPDPTKFKKDKLQEMTELYDRDGKRFTEIYADDNRRKWVPIRDIPEIVQNAVIAAEDKNFREHNGIDIRGVIRALKSTLNASGQRSQGGSTITQQVVKNLLLNDDYTIERKIREMYLAVKIESLHSKNEILELYLNFVFLGRASWGVEMAAQSYFGKSIKKVTQPAEAAFLASLIRGPGFYNPDLHPERVHARQGYVLDQMAKNHFLDDTIAQTASEENVMTIPFESPKKRAAFYFTNAILREAKQLNFPSLTSSSYKVFTTLNPKLQKSVEIALQDGLADFETATNQTSPFEPEFSLEPDLADDSSTWLDELQSVQSNYYDIHWPLGVVLQLGSHPTIGLNDGRILPLAMSPAIAAKIKRFDVVRVQVGGDGRVPTATIRIPPKVQGAVVVLEAKTGRVLAMTGGFSYAASTYDRATKAERQVGSTLKPFIYLTAFQEGFPPNTLAPDLPINLPPIERGGQPFSPRNYEKSCGNVSFRHAVEFSMNRPTVATMSRIAATPQQGLDKIRALTQEVGIYNDPERNYPFVLGSQATRLLDMAVGYATIANLGWKPTPHFIDSIEHNGELVLPERRFNLKKITRADQVSFYQIRHVLEGVVERGTAMKIQDLSGIVAGKTGTTNDYNDAWFIGFTNDLVVATWVGNDDNSTLGDGHTGAVVALPITERVLRDSFRIYKDKEPLVGPPDTIKDQILTSPIDPESGEFGGNYLEAFRASGQRDIRSLLLNSEINSYTCRDGRDGDQRSAPRSSPQTPNHPYPRRSEPPAYQPGSESNTELWSKRGRRIDDFFTPFFGGR